MGEFHLLALAPQGEAHHASLGSFLLLEVLKALEVPRED
jgi:hypothetical protein